MPRRKPGGTAGERSPAPALARHAESAAEERLRGHRTECHDHFWLDAHELRGQPHPAGFLLGRVGALVEPELPARLVLEVLDGVGDVHLAAIDAGLIERTIEELAGRADEGSALVVLLKSRLLANQHDAGVGRTFTEYGLRGVLPEITSAAVARLAP